MLIASADWNSLILQEIDGSRESWYFRHSVVALMEPLPCDKCLLLLPLYSAVWQSDRPKELGQWRNAAEKLL